MDQEQIIAAAITDVLAREGGSNGGDARDRGGPTNSGITIATLRAYLGREATLDELWALDEAAKRRIYRWFIHQAKLDGIADPRVLSLMIDCAVLHGPGHAVPMFQRALGVPDDGALGPQTYAALAAADPDKLWHLVLAERAMFIAGAIAHQLEDRNGNGIPDGVEYARGWVRRGVADFLRGRAA